MNNKGQTLVIFVILLPLFMALCAFVIDVGLMTYENVKLKNTTKTILNSVASKNKITEDNIRNLYKKNDIDIVNIKIQIDKEKIIVENDYYIDSLFGKILKIKEYEVRVVAKMNRETMKIIFE